MNRLLEVLRQSGAIERSSNIVINIFERGSQHVERVDKQYFYGEGQSHQAPPRVGKEAEPGKLPEVLGTEEAMRLWQKAQEAGWIDANYQPLLSRTQSALLAETMARRLGIKAKWKVFEMLWNRKNMYRDYYKALSLQQSLAFQDEMKETFD